MRILDCLRISQYLKYQIPNTKYQIPNIKYQIPIKSQKFNIKQKVK